MEIHIQNRQRKRNLKIPRLKQTIRKTLRALDLEKCEVSFLFVDNEEITRFNKKYFKRDCPTDVISFPLDLAFGETPANHFILNLGDVVISSEKAAEQAKRYRKTFESELNLLIVHGILHLLGYDDLKKADKIIMRNAEKEILKKINLV